MTRYFYDTEFLDDGKTIEFISIGIVAEDGREYYAINEGADWGRIKENSWLMQNVVPQLEQEFYKPKAQIASEIQEFILSDLNDTPELWAWYAAYDHVVLSQLYGRMLDLPSGMPMYSHDLRAFLDYTNVKKLPYQEKGEHNALEDARCLRDRFEYVVRVVAEGMEE